MMPNVLKCVCGKCKTCKARIRKARSREHTCDIHSNIFQSSLTYLLERDFYLGHPPPKCGRVPPKPVF